MSLMLRGILAMFAASAIALPKQAECPAANNCSGLVPAPCDPAGESARLIFPSGLVALPSRPAVAVAVSDASTAMECLQKVGSKEWSRDDCTLAHETGGIPTLLGGCPAPTALPQPWVRDQPHRRPHKGALRLLR